MKTKLPAADAIRKIIREARGHAVILDADAAALYGVPGVAMLSSVLRSEQAILVNIEIMRTFVSMRKDAGTDRGLVRQLNALEATYDRKLRHVFDAIRILITGQATLQARVKRLEQPTPPNLRRIR